MDDNLPPRPFLSLIFFLALLLFLTVTDVIADDVTAAVVHSTTETFKDLNKGDEDKATI